MSGNDGVQVVRDRVAILHLFPEVGSAGALDPGHIGVEFADVARYCDDVLFLQEAANLRVAAGQSL